MFITEWGSPYVHITEEAILLREKYRKSKDETERQEIKLKLLNITDTRLFCVVFNCENNSIRHVVRVTDEAETHLSKLKEEYYSVYNSYPTDRFIFFKGLHRANRFADTLALSNYSVREMEIALKDKLNGGDKNGKKTLDRDL